MDTLLASGSSTSTIPPPPKIFEQIGSEPTDTIDPKLLQQKNLIELLFGVDTPLIDKPTPPKKQTDSVDISPQGVKLAAAQVSTTAVTIEGPNFKITYSRTDAAAVSLSTEATQVKQSDPLVIDLTGNGIALTDMKNDGGVMFDIDGNGKKEQVSWTGAGTAFLALDRNGDGRISSGKELFGDQHGAADGFAELRKFDANSDGLINVKDPVYSKLQLWSDENRDGISSSNELRSLANAGISQINLKQTAVESVVAGNRVAAVAAYRSTGGGSGVVGEAWLNTRA